MTDQRLTRIEQAVFGTPWAITPQMMQVVSGVVADWATGVKNTVPAGQYQNAPIKVDTSDGVAVIPIHGVMAKRMNLFMEISGGVSTEQASAAFMDAIHDPAVKGIVFDIDSPGGVVNGSFQLADLVYENRGKKPTVALIDGLGASAAYLLASATDRIIANDAAYVGSIGVVASLLDDSRALANAGLKQTTIIGGRYKTGGPPGLSDKESTEYLQGHVDNIYGQFVGRVARNRGVSEETVETDMAQGRIFIGEQAKTVGLIDEIGGPDAAIDAARALINVKRVSLLNTTSRGEPRGKDTRMNENKITETTGAAQEAAPPLAAERPPVTAEQVAVSTPDATLAVTAHYQATLAACAGLGLSCADAQAILAEHPDDTVAAQQCAIVTAAKKYGSPIAIATGHSDRPETPTLEKTVEAENDGFAKARKAVRKEG